MTFPASVPSVPGMPRNWCERCGEVLPHYCAAAVTIGRARFTGKRVVVITDRMPVSAYPDVGATGNGSEGVAA